MILMICIFITLYNYFLWTVDDDLPYSRVRDFFNIPVTKSRVMIDPHCEEGIN